MRIRSLQRQIHVMIIFSLALVMGASVCPAQTISSYSVNDKVMMDPLCEEIAKDLKINVSNLSMGGGVMWTRISSEAPNIQADMSIGVNLEQAMELKKLGLLQPYKSKTWEKIPAGFKDKDGYYYADSLWTAMPIVNTDILKKKGLPMPTSWEDLTDPRWKGEIVMPDPMTSSSAYLVVLGLVKQMGEDKAFEYMEKLHKNVAQYAKSGGAPALLVARGEAAFGITDSTSAYARISEGFPIALAIPKEGVPYLLTTNVIFASTKDPERLAACKKVIDYIGSLKCQNLIGTYRPIVANPEAVALEKTFGKITLQKDFTPEFIVENKARLQKKWQEKFSGK
ncbi:MAG: extracellular solute-binding protein [Desulfobacteraceae bacterium]|nr:extracellular solute-binding protein [Desulfobacteraceae bacterium]